MDTQVSLKKWILTCFSVLAVALFMVGCGGSSSGGGGGGEPAPRDTVQLSGLVTTASTGPSSANSGFNGFVAALDTEGGLLVVKTDGEGNYDFSGDNGLTRGASYTLYIMGANFNFLGILRVGGNTGLFSLSSGTYRVDLAVDETTGNVDATPQTGSEAFTSLVTEDTTGKIAVTESGTVEATQPNFGTVQVISLANFIGNPGTWSINYDRYSDSEELEEERTFSVNSQINGDRIQREAAYFVKEGWKDNGEWEWDWDAQGFYNESYYGYT